MTEQVVKDIEEKNQKITLMRKIKFYLKTTKEYTPNSLKYMKSRLIFVFILWDEMFEGSMFA